MLGWRIASQSEVMRAIVSGYKFSPCCGVPHLHRGRQDDFVPLLHLACMCSESRVLLQTVDQLRHARRDAPAGDFRRQLRRARPVGSPPLRGQRQFPHRELRGIARLRLAVQDSALWCRASRQRVSRAGRMVEWCMHVRGETGTAGRLLPSKRGRCVYRPYCRGRVRQRPRERS